MLGKNDENFVDSFAESIILEWVLAKFEEPDLNQLESEIKECTIREEYLELAERYGLKEPEFNRQMSVRHKMVEGKNKYNRK